VVNAAVGGPSCAEANGRQANSSPRISRPTSLFGSIRSRTSTLRTPTIAVHRAWCPDVRSRRADRSLRPPFFLWRPSKKWHPEGSPPLPRSFWVAVPPFWSIDLSSIGNYPDAIALWKRVKRQQCRRRCGGIPIPVSDKSSSRRVPGRSARCPNQKEAGPPRRSVPGLARAHKSTGEISESPGINMDALNPSEAWVEVS
jgi:hypothetical protein